MCVREHKSRKRRKKPEENNNDDGKKKSREKLLVSVRFARSVFFSLYSSFFFLPFFALSNPIYTYTWLIRVNFWKYIAVFFS